MNCSAGREPLGRRAFLVRSGTVAAALAIWPSAHDLRAAAWDPIYQRIWDADQSASGMPAFRRLAAAASLTAESRNAPFTGETTISASSGADERRAIRSVASRFSHTAR